MLLGCLSGRVAQDERIRLLLTETKPSDATHAMANALRRVALAEVPTYAIEVVNVRENTSGSNTLHATPICGLCQR